jgi:hypothetical protein
MAFDAEKHFIQLPRSVKQKDGTWKEVEDDYLEVKWRLVWFRDRFPNGTITTEEVHVDLDREVTKESTYYDKKQQRRITTSKTGKGYARFRCQVTNGEGGSATGYGTESAVEFGDFIEKAECTSLDTEILTKKGFKLYDQLVAGEEVLAYDTKSDACYWTPLRRVTVYQQAKMIRLHSPTFEVYCTPDHSWPVYYMAEWHGKRYEYRTLVKANALKTYQRLILSALCTDGSHSLSSRDAAIIGWIMTDGSLQGKPGHGQRATIHQSKPKTVKVIRQLVGSSASEAVSAATVRTFPNGRTYQCLPGYRWSFSAAETRRLLTAAGIRGSGDLPEMVTQYSHDARAAMLEAMMMADGDKRGYFGKKRKPGVMEAWQILATLEGYAVSAMYQRDIPIQRLKKRRTVCVSELTIDEVKNADVWCPTTDYGTWVMRQNGRVMITGNTRAVGRALAMLGIGTQFVGQELTEGDHIADAPVRNENPATIEAVESSEEPPPILHPSDVQVNYLMEQGLHAYADKALLARAIRITMALSGEVAITKRFLRAQMTMPQYTEVLAAIDDIITQREERDTPEFPPQMPQAPSSPPEATNGHNPPVETPQPPAGPRIGKPSEWHALTEKYEVLQKIPQMRLDVKRYNEIWAMTYEEAKAEIEKLEAEAKRSQGTLVEE